MAGSLSVRRSWRTYLIHLTLMAMDILPSMSFPPALVRFVPFVSTENNATGIDCALEAFFCMCFCIFLGEFLFGQKISVEKAPCKSHAEVLYQTQWEAGLARGEDDEEEKHFCMLMESLGANSVFEE